MPTAPAASAAVLYHFTNRLAGLPLVVLCEGSTQPRNMSNGEWITQRERKRAKEEAKEEQKLSREEAREAARRLKIEFADKLWLASTHPCDDAVLAWLSENRAEASKIGSSRWHLETLPKLHKKQQELRQAAAFQEVLDRAACSTQTLTVEQVLASSPQNPQVEPVEKQKTPRANKGKRQPSRKRSAAPSK